MELLGVADVKDNNRSVLCVLCAWQCKSVQVHPGWPGQASSGTLQPPAFRSEV